MRWKIRLQEAMAKMEMDENAVQDYYEANDSDEECPTYDGWKQEVKKALLEKEAKEFQEVCTHPDRPKLHIIGRLKDRPVMEQWVGGKAMDSIELIRLKLRLGTNGLRADPVHGRNTVKTCASCGIGQETTAHLLLHCKEYCEERKEAMDNLSPVALKQFEDQYKVGKCAMMLTGTPNDDVDVLAVKTFKTYLNKIWNKRNELLDKWMESDEDVKDEEDEDEEDDEGDSADESNPDSSDSGDPDSTEPDDSNHEEENNSKGKITDYFAPSRKIHPFFRLNTKQTNQHTPNCMTVPRKGRSQLTTPKSRMCLIQENIGKYPCCCNCLCRYNCTCIYNNNIICNPHPLKEIRNQYTPSLPEVEGVNDHFGQGMS